MTEIRSPIFSRRTLMTAAGAVGVVSGARAAQEGLSPPASPSEDVARDEAFWSRVAAQYDVSAAYTNLENGYWGVMARPVRAAYEAHQRRVNRENTRYVRGQFWDDMKGVYARLAAFLGVGAEELLLVRSATEALQILIGSYNGLKPGDEVLYADLDYSAMKSSMDWLAERRGVSVRKITLPEPASREGVLAAYRSAFEQYPKVKLVLLTQVNNLTGLIHPVEEIAAMAKGAGAEVVLDSAHAVGQIEFQLSELGADFIGMNLHKWIGAPLGCGLIYIRKDRVPSIDRYMGEPGREDDIRARAHLGGFDFAAHLTVPDALDFHEAVGGAASKQPRLKYLRDLWAQPAREMPHIDVLTPDDPDLVAAMTSFRLKGRTSTEENDAIVKRLLRDHGVFTVRRTGPAAGDCVRVTPAIYNQPEDAAKLVGALKAIA
ncbi:MAG: aminotransferase class V-fold PLP-dependent enzyme [Pseudomonadota bacterium]